MRAQYFVTRDHDQWVVLYEFRHYGPYDDGSKHAALTAAIDSAQQAGQRGFQAEVLVAPDDSDGYQTVWVYGRDAYPPLPGDQTSGGDTNAAPSGSGAPR